jgi:hypothetical protein
MHACVPWPRGLALHSGPRALAMRWSTVDLGVALGEGWGGARGADTTDASPARKLVYGGAPSELSMAAAVL